MSYNSIKMNWNEIDKKAQIEGISRFLVAGEIIQIAFLDAFYKDTSSQNIFFQGGTSIRLLHQGWRYSEDLDFVSMNISSDDFDQQIKASFRHSLQTLDLLLGPGTFSAELKTKKERPNVKTFWIHLLRSGERQPYKVKLEFAHFPVHRPQPMALKRIDLPLPFIPLVMAEELPELLADKITAFAGRPYIKGRDLFDLWFLSEVCKTKLEIDLVKQKFLDYSVKNPADLIQKNLAAMTLQHLSDEMDRFLPNPYRTNMSEHGYRIILAFVHKILGEVLHAI